MSLLTWLKGFFSSQHENKPVEEPTPQPLIPTDTHYEGEVPGFIKTPVEEIEKMQPVEGAYWLPEKIREQLEAGVNLVIFDKVVHRAYFVSLEALRTMEAKKTEEDELLIAHLKNAIFGIQSKTENTEPFCFCFITKADDSRLPEILSRAFDKMFVRDTQYFIHFGVTRSDIRHVRPSNADFDVKTKIFYKELKDWFHCNHLQPKPQETGIRAITTDHKVSHFTEKRGKFIINIYENRVVVTLIDEFLPKKDGKPLQRILKELDRRFKDRKIYVVGAKETDIYKLNREVDKLG